MNGYKVDTSKMRNQPSDKTGKTDKIDRHTKKRLIIIDFSLLITQSAQDYIMLIMDIAEISDYFDVIVTCRDAEMEYARQFLEHWALVGEVKEEYTGYEDLLEEYRVLVCFTAKKNREAYKKYYRCDVMSR